MSPLVSDVAFRTPRNRLCPSYHPLSLISPFVSDIVIVPLTIFVLSKQNATYTFY